MPDVYVVSYNTDSFQLPAHLPCHIGQKVYELAQQHVREHSSIRGEHLDKVNASPHLHNRLDVWVDFTVTVPAPEPDIFDGLLVDTGA